MPDQSDQFRKAAADCVRLARRTTDLRTRASLLVMAQRWYDMANGPSTNFDAVQRAFNEAQMAPRPVMQQQQQVQPKKEQE